MQKLVEKEDILNIYPHGSRVYGTATEDSDYDYILVVEDEKYTKDSWKEGNAEFSIYSKTEWEKEAEKNSVDFCECFFLPEEEKIKETFVPEFKIEKEKIRKEFSRTASNSWVKCKKKLTVEKDFSPYIGKKSLWHSLRILFFGIQILEFGRIVDYGVAKRYYAAIVQNKKNDWEYYKNNWQKTYNSLKSEFRKYDAGKQAKEGQQKERA